MGNATPQFLVRSVRPVGRAKVLKEKHLKFQVRSGSSAVVDCIGFGMADMESMVNDGKVTALDLAARVEINEWQGRRTVQMQVRAIRPAEPETDGT
jgi:single-stranded-DNA-specific exonuclease